MTTHTSHINTVSTDWLLCVEPRIAFHRDDMRSSIVASLTALLNLVPLYADNIVMIYYGYNGVFVDAS